MSVTMTFQFQRPTSDQPRLLDDLRTISVGARDGGMVMAWANAPAIVAFSSSPEFEELIERGSFDIVVGLDSITDEAAIRKLIELDVRYVTLTASAFLNPGRGLFHPKVAWFDSGEELRLLIGSGNLTMGGLSKNWEAYSIAVLNGPRRDQQRNALNEWRLSMAAALLPIDDPSVLARARLNSGNETTLRARPPAGAGQEPVASPAQDVLACEIPLQRNRQGQANVAKAHYLGFFGFEIGTRRQAILYRVDDAGHIGSPEVRQSVQVASRNYRIELAGMLGFEYDLVRRPIGVFVPAGDGDFLYMLLTATSPHYDCVSTALDGWSTSPAHQMRRALTTLDALRVACPQLPITSSSKPPI